MRSGTTRVLDRVQPLDALDGDGDELPAPSTLAPMRLRKAARSAISGSRAALSIVVVPLARTAAIRAFSVAPTLGNSSTIRVPSSRSARPSM